MLRTAAVVAVCLPLALPAALSPGGPLASPAYLAGLAVIVAGLWWGAHDARPPARRGWILVAVTASMWFAGDVLQRVLEARGVVGGVGPADLLWLGSYGTLAAGVVVMIRSRGLPRGVLREVRLDVTIVTAAALLPVWRFMIAPGVRDGALDLETAVAVLYPIGDVVLLALALTLVLAPGARGAAGWLLIGCLAATLGTDAMFAILPEVAPAFDASRLDGLLLVANSLLAAAALHPSREALAQAPAGAERAAMHRWRVVLLGSGLAATTLGAALAPDASTLDRALGAAAGLLVALAIMQRFYGVVRERESAEARLYHQAHHDALTGLANRSLMLTRLGALLFAPSDPRGLAVLYIDLDGFKGVNDRWGHAAGDAVLRATADRLTARTRREDMVARVGGDEFVVLCSGILPEEAEALGRALRAELQGPVAIGAGATTVAIDASVGVYATRSVDVADASMDADALLRAADSAMYLAKRGGGGVRTAAPPQAALLTG